MSSLHTLLHYLTVYQLASLVFILSFATLETLRWKSLINTDPSFIKRFRIRCIFMLTTFAVCKPLTAFIISVVLMILVLIPGGFYYDIPDDNEKEWVSNKHKTMFLTIPWCGFFQLLLWVFIDVVAFVVWMIVLPWIAGKIIPLDSVVIERFF